MTLHCWKRLIRNLKIRLKGGGALTAGQAVRHFDGVHIKSVDLTISSKAFGEPNELPKIEQIALHELGHSLGDGHANFPDLMAPVLGPVSTISTCDVDGVRAANAWYFDNPNDPGMPVAPAVSEVECGSGSAPANDVGLTAITGPETAAQGDTVVISLTVFNHGTNSATFNLTASKAAPGPESASLLVTLSSGESGDFTLTWPTDAGTSLGLHTWTFTHDLSGDGDSANDKVYHTVEITEPSEEEPDCPPRSRSPQCRNP